MHSVACQFSVKQILVFYIHYTPKEKFNSNGEENLRNTIFFFALNKLNAAECLACARIIRKKYKYLLKRHYRSYHTKLHSIMSKEESAFVP